MAKRSRGEVFEDKVSAKIEESGQEEEAQGGEEEGDTHGVRHSIVGTGKKVTELLDKVYGDGKPEEKPSPKSRGRRKVESKEEFVDAIADPLNSVRIKRVYPDSFGEFDLRGQTIKIHTPTSHEKITERITSNFGGGEYKAYVYPDGDDDTIIAANLFSIEGDPIIPSRESTPDVPMDLPTPESILSDASAQAQAELERKKVEFEKLKIDLEMKALKEGETKKEPTIDVKSLIESNTKMILEFQERLQRTTMDTLASMNRSNNDQRVIEDLKMEIQQLKMGGGKRSDDSAILTMLMNQNNGLLAQISQRPRGDNRSVLGDAMEVLEMIRTVKNEVTGGGVLQDDPNSLSAIVSSLMPAVSKITDAMKERGYSQEQVEGIAKKTTIDVIRKVMTPEMLAESMLKALPQVAPVAQISAPHPQPVAQLVPNPVPQPVMPATTTVEEKEKMPTDTEVMQDVVKTILAELPTCPAEPEWVNLAYENLSDETLAQINNVSMVGNPNIHKDLEAIVRPKCSDELYNSMVIALETDKKKQEWIGFSIMALQHEYRESVLKGRT